MSFIVSIFLAIGKSLDTSNKGIVSNGEECMVQILAIMLYNNFARKEKRQFHIVKGNYQNQIKESTSGVYFHES